MNQTSLNIGEEQRNEIVSLFNHYLPDKEVWAFGSRIKHSSRKNSDLDLVVFAETNDILKVNILKDAFDESNIPFRIDLHVWNELPESFQENIRNEYVVINH